MSISGIAGHIDTAESWTVCDAGNVDNDDVVYGDVFVHDTDAHIAIDEAEDAVRTYLPSGMVYRFEAELLPLGPAVERLADRYDTAAAIDSERTDDEALYTYYAVINEYGHGPVPLCREGGDEAVYDNLKRAVVVAERIRHKYGNREIRVIQLDRQRVDGL